MDSTKKKFEVLGVQLGASRSMDQVASDLTAKLNELNEGGYSVQVLPVNDGILILGRKADEGRENPIERLFEVLSKSNPSGDPAEEEGFTDRVERLLARVRAEMGADWLTSFESKMPKVLPAVLKEAPLTSIRDVAQECEDCAARHEKKHENEADHTGCPYPALLRSMAKHMREYARLHVQ